jgi:hypothetical protein
MAVDIVLDFVVNLVMDLLVDFGESLRRRKNGISFNGLRR